MLSSWIEEYVFHVIPPFLEKSAHRCWNHGVPARRPFGPLFLKERSAALVSRTEDPRPSRPLFLMINSDMGRLQCNLRFVDVAHRRCATLLTLPPSIPRGGTRRNFVPFRKGSRMPFRSPQWPIRQWREGVPPPGRKGFPPEKRPNPPKELCHNILLSWKNPPHRSAHGFADKGGPKAF